MLFRRYLDLFYRFYSLTLIGNNMIWAEINNSGDGPQGPAASLCISSSLITGLFNSAPMQISR